MRLFAFSCFAAALAASPALAQQPLASVESAIVPVIIGFEVMLL